MKKLFFTAIATVAFSSVSMASNAVEVEICGNSDLKTENVSDNHIPPSFIKILVECVKVYKDVKDAYTPILGEEQANAIAEGAYAGCLRAI